MTTMREVAAIAGVSAKTVSRVFNDDPHVLPETRARVEAVLRQLNYVPNALATTFRSGRARVIGIAFPDLSDPFFSAIAKAAETLAANHDMSVVVTTLGEDIERERDTVESLLKRTLSGLIIAPISSDQSYLESWAQRTSLVFVDRAPMRLNADCFTDDDETGAFEATTHLIEHGHRRIAFLGDHVSLPTTRNRLAGYGAALAASGLPYIEELVVLGAVDRLGAAGAVDELRSLADPPTAIFSSNARCTMSAVPALRTTDFAVVGFGDFPMADMLSPSLTVIDQDPAELGRLAAQRIIDRLEHPDRRYRRRTVLPVRLIERESCAVGRPPASAGPEGGTAG